MTTPPKIAHAAHRAMLAMHREPIRDEDVERLRRLTVEAGIPWRLHEPHKPEDLWCATCVAAAYRKVGDYITPGVCRDITLRADVANFFWASTSRLMGKTHTYASKGVEPPHEIEPSNAQAGDILLIHTPRTTRAWGDHVAMASGPMEGDTIKTIAGNEWGTGPDGARMKGVVTNERELDEIAHILRPPLSWFEGAYVDVLRDEMEQRA